MSDIDALIAEARRTQGYSEGDLRSLARSLADALATTQAELVKSDRAFSKLKEQHAKSDVALVDAKAELVALRNGATS